MYICKISVSVYVQACLCACMHSCVCMHSCAHVRMHALVHACMAASCVCAHAFTGARMHGCILCVHANVDVFMYHLQVYEFVYPFKCVICHSCMCVQLFILIHSVCFVLLLTLNMLVITFCSLVINAIKNILNFKL